MDQSLGNLPCLTMREPEFHGLGMPKVGILVGFESGSGDVACRCCLSVCLTVCYYYYYYALYVWRALLSWVWYSSCLSL